MKNSIIIFAIALFAGAIFMTGCDQGREYPTMDERVVTVSVKEDPTVSFRIWFRVGAQDDPAGKEGLAWLTAQTMANGATQNNKYEEIIDKLYPMAADYGVKVDKEMTVFSGRVHKDMLDEYYKLFTDAMLHPAFNKEDFQRIKDETISYIANELRYSSDEELGKAALYSYIYEGTNYGHLTQGTVESLKSITLEDVKNFYKDHYTRDNYVIGAGGGFDKELPEKMFVDFQSLVQRIPELKAATQPEKIEGLNVLLVEKDNDATAISFGFPIDVQRGDDDFFALALFNSWFGQHRNSASHLYQVIRETRGMNYGDYSYIEPFLNGGSLRNPIPNNARRSNIFEVWIRPVRHEHAHFALRAAIRELRKVIENGLSEEEFVLTQDFLHKYALHYAPNTMMRLGYQLDSKFFGIEDGGDYIEFFRNKIRSLTRKQVNEAIRNHLNYQNIKIAMVTNNAEDFKSRLVDNAPSPISYETPKPDAVIAEDQVIAEYPLDIKAENVIIVPVDQMFEKTVGRVIAKK
ncbi:MAG: M16 family metallopeptidase [Candidatus Kapaibacterium sp.]